MLRRLLLYLEKHWEFSSLQREAKDSREYCTITAGDVFVSMFMLFTMRLRSLNVLEQSMKNSSRFKKLFSVREPSADTIGYSLSRFDLDRLRLMLVKTARMAKRKKVLKRLSSTAGQQYWVSAIDGHELWSGTKRCCSECLTREITTVTGKHTQYYHKVVVLQLIGIKPALILDIEPVLPGEGEIAAAIRIVRRARKYYPRFFDVIVADALYLIKPFADAVLEEGYEFVIVLKQENRELYKDADGLKKIVECGHIETDKGTIQLWDFENMKSWTQLDYPVRVICSDEKVAQQKAVVESQWRWVTCFPASVVPAEMIYQWGHARWDIENRGFNELVQHWNMNHCFRHNPVAIIAALMIMSMAFALTTIFFERNLRQEIRKNHTRLFLASLFFADFLVQQGHSFRFHPT